MKKKLSKKDSSNFVVAAVEPFAFDCLIETISDIVKHDFFIRAMKIGPLNEEELKVFYKKHQEKDWFDNKIKLMKDKDMCIFLLQKENAMAEFKEIKGHNTPSVAGKHTLRGQHGVCAMNSGFSSSSSSKETLEKIIFFFPEIEVEE